MSKAIRVLQGSFGRVALLDMNEPLVEHAHHHCHMLLKSFGHDTAFQIRDEIRYLTDDTAVLINSWEPHCYVHRVGAPKTLILALYVEPRWLTESDRTVFRGMVSPFFACRQAYVSPHARKIIHALTELILDFNTIASDEVETLLLSLIMSTIDRRSIGAEAMVRPISDYRIRKAIAFLHDNLGSHLAVEEVANHAGISRPHFFTLFRRCTGLSPRMYFNVLRMEEAIRMLSLSRQPLADVAFDLGFDAQSNFTRFFRQHLGVPPMEFRKATDFIGTNQPIDVESCRCVGGVTWPMANKAPLGMPGSSRVP